MQIAGIFSAMALIGACFMPWAHYNNINETFTGFQVSRFPGGTYYGRAGMIVSVLTGVVLLLMLIPRIWAKRINLFLAAFLFAYCIRTYIIFTSATFEGEVEKKAGIYLLIILSFLVLMATVFPSIGEKTDQKR